jgi:hypothetical protein
MTAVSAHTIPAIPVGREAVRHWHVIESDAGHLPETEPDTCDDGMLALDALAHQIKDWAQAQPDPEDLAATAAEGVAEIYCTCRAEGRSAEHRDAVSRVESGRGVSEQFDQRVFELTPCTEYDCLKFCPDAECGTFTPITDLDDRCWCCGATWVDREACGWLA